MQKKKTQIALRLRLINNYLQLFAAMLVEEQVPV